MPFLMPFKISFFVPAGINPFLFMNSNMINYVPIRSCSYTAPAAVPSNIPIFEAILSQITMRHFMGSPDEAIKGTYFNHVKNYLNQAVLFTKIKNKRNTTVA